MRLSEAQAQQIVAHARADAPREACGIIAGRGETASEIIPIPNAAADPLHTYYMDERRLAEALISLEQRKLELVGFYHSHPNGEPLPSPTDTRQATYPDTPYLIVGLKGEAKLAAWLLRRGQVTPVTLYIGSLPPAEAPQTTPTQRAAVIISALIALAVLIVVSLTLLPPAPVIPR